MYITALNTKTHLLTNSAITMISKPDAYLLTSVLLETV